MDAPDDILKVTNILFFPEQCNHFDGKCHLTNYFCILYDILKVTVLEYHIPKANVYIFGTNEKTANYTKSCKIIDYEDIKVKVLYKV